MKSKILSPKERRDADRARAKRAALRALKKAKNAADAAQVTLSDWEGEFLGSVEERVERFGRAFRDPEKGGPGAALSMLQAQKLKEISAKAKGRKTPWQRRPPLQST
ncbi:MAG TPA: hypothetical protein VG889_15850 [Rhizomicrobium sp.]|nr:hypothetical protein [Rhizomicrobium sp.]